MKVQRQDLGPLRTPLAALVVSIVATLLLIDYADDKRSVEQQSVFAARARAEEAKKRYLDSDSSVRKTVSTGSTRCVSLINGREISECSIS
jgi:hypothetical protein